MTPIQAFRRGVGRRVELVPMNPVEQLRAGRLAHRVTQLLVGLVLFGISMALLLRAAARPRAVGRPPVRPHPARADVLRPHEHRRVVRRPAAVDSPPPVARSRHGAQRRRHRAWPSTPRWPWCPRSRGSAGAWSSCSRPSSATASPEPCTSAASSGPGPRDGLMTGLSRRTGRSIRLVRTAFEVTVVLLGWLLGGIVGIGTVLYALLIGPVVQLFLPMLTVRVQPADRRQHVLSRCRRSSPGPATRWPRRTEPSGRVPRVLSRRRRARTAGRPARRRGAVPGRRR